MGSGGRLYEGEKILLAYLLIFVNIVLMVAGQSLWKMGIEREGGFRLEHALSFLTSPWIVAGIALYGAATVIWLAVLSRLPLSVAYPLQSLAYVLGMFAAYYWFHEAIPPHRWVGVGIIVLGVFIISIEA